MKLKHLLPTLLLLVACSAAAAQSDDDLGIPDEQDNQFPPDAPAAADDLEGSGAGVLDTPIDDATQAPLPALEDIEPPATTVAPADQTICPDTCTCSLEGEDFTVDCSYKGLTELPTNIDARTTTLNIQNNEITEIPKSIADLKNLKVLNANSNSITSLAPGSVSELPELKILNLANNRLLEYPQELKNGFSLTKLEEIDLSGNDIRETLLVENFSNFKAVKKIALPSTGTDVSELLCQAYKDTLQAVCFGACETNPGECPDAPENVGEEYLSASLPGSIALSNVVLDSIGNVDGPTVTEISVAAETTTTGPEQTTPGDDEFSLRTAVKKSDLVDAGIELSRAFVENPPEAIDGNEVDVKVGATTTEAKGGVDKSVIGMVVAGMIVVVAGITIKKNWGSLRKRFSAAPRPAAGAAANGTSPEEVPLQDKDKSPV